MSLACLPLGACPCSPGHKTWLPLPLSQSFSPEAQAERSFHVFYELLAGLDPVERGQLSLQGPETYYYLNQVRGGAPQCRATGPAQGVVPAQGLGEGG